MTMQQYLEVLREQVNDNVENGFDYVTLDPKGFTKVLDAVETLKTTLKEECRCAKIRIKCTPCRVVFDVERDFIS